MKRASRQRPVLADRGPILTAEQVGERLQLKAREIRRLFAPQTIRFGKKLVRYAWGEILEALEHYRNGNGRST